MKRTRNSVRRWTAAGAAALALILLAPAVQARDFFSALFGGFGRFRPPNFQMPFDESGAPAEPRQRDPGGLAFCVRTCDGRHFPIAVSDDQSRAAVCGSLCPAAETKVVYGSSIDNAATETGQPYSALPNAFRYRNEIVAGCTCDGKHQIGLAKIRIEDDPTLRKGDIVAGKDGLAVANKSADKSGAPPDFAPASARIEQRFRRAPVVAKE